MTNKKLITRFLDENYIIVAEFDVIKARDKISDTSYLKINFFDMITLIFGDFNGITGIIDNWWYTNTNVFMYELFTVIHKESEGSTSISLIEKCVASLSGTNRYHDSFIKKVVDEWYYKAVFEPKMIGFFNKCILVLGTSDWDLKHEILGVIRDVGKFFKDETHFQLERLGAYYDKWYDDAVIIASEKAMKNF